MATKDKLQTPEDFDEIVSAKLPDEKQNPKLFEIVSKYMIHRFCKKINLSSSCMVEGKCSKYYPRDFTTTTTTNKNNYPVYKRRDNRRFIKKRGISINIDNR